MPTPLDALCMSYLAYELPSTFSIDSGRTNLPLDGVFGVSPQVPISGSASLLASYPVSLQEKKGKIHHLTRRGWKYFSAEKHELSGYQSVVFINHAAKEVVLSHRGTVSFTHGEFKENAKCDVQILSAERASLTPELTSLLSNLFSFITKTKRKLSAEYPDYCMWQTGHSLGGFLAELGAAYLAYPKRIPGDEWLDEINDQYKESSHRDGLPYHGHYFRLSNPRYQHANAIAFDGLGSINILAKLGITNGKANSHHYFLEPNIANTANPHDGTRYILLPSGINYFKYNNPEEHNTSVANHAHHNIDELSLTASSHSLDKMMSRLNLNTGEADNKQVILNWPVGVNEFATGERPERPSGTTITDLFRYVATTTAHTITDGVASFAHERYGDLDYENRAAQAPNSFEFNP